MAVQRSARFLASALLVSLPAFGQTGECPPSGATDGGVAGQAEGCPDPHGPLTTDTRGLDSNWNDIQLDLQLERLGAHPSDAPESPERKKDELRTRPVPAVAADDLPPKLGGLVVGARIGFGFSVGTLKASWSAVSHYAPWSVPLELELSGRLRSGLGFGGYFQFAPAGTANCPSSGMCHALTLRTGLRAEFRFLNGWLVMPWFGAAFGWEWLMLREGGFLAQTVNLSGPELGLQAGVEFRIGRRWTIGPYVAAHLSQYVLFNIEGFFGEDAQVFPSSERTVHAWLMAGGRTSVTF